MRFSSELFRKSFWRLLLVCGTLAVPLLVYLVPLSLSAGEKLSHRKHDRLDVQLTIIMGATFLAIATIGLSLLLSVVIGAIGPLFRGRDKDI